MIDADDACRSAMQRQITLLSARLGEIADLKEALDGLVHDAASAKATEVNNAGESAQLQYLLCRGLSPEQILTQLNNR